MRIFLIVLLFWTQLAFAGGTVGNGGDPKVIEFLQIAEDVCAWASLNHKKEYSEILACDSLLEKMKVSLNGPGKAKLRFTNQDLFDQGISKAAIYNLKEGSITVNRDLWSQSAKAEKYTLVAIELAGLSQVKKRYEFGQMAKENFKNIYTAKYLVCSIDRVDLATGFVRNLVRQEKQEIDFKYDKSFSAQDGNIRVELLVHSPLKKQDQLGISWSLRSVGQPESDLEKVLTYMDFNPFSEMTTRVILNQTMYQAHCQALGK